MSSNGGEARTTTKIIKCNTTQIHVSASPNVREMKQYTQQMTEPLTHDNETERRH